MQKATFCLIACCMCLVASAQNLLGNKGFEERNICLEYTVKCAPEAWFFVPRYAKMSPEDGSSNHYEVILMGNAHRPFSVGNFIYTKLFCPLVAGVQYNLTLKINTVGFEFDYLDIWMGESEPWRGRYTFSSIKPVFKIRNDSIEDGKLRSWRTVSYTFTAKGGERFFMLGNIAQEPLLNARKYSRKHDRVEYWIDDVELCALDPSFAKCPEYEAIKDQVYRNDFRHPSRFIDDVEIDTSLIEKKEPPKADPPVVIPVTPKTDTLIIPDVLFKFDKSDLNSKFISMLDSFVNAIKSKPFTKLLVAGHTDNYGTGEYNLKLSQERANTIRNYLLQKLMINADAIVAKGYGESQPRATNTTAAGRQQNRRVEIIIYY